MKRAHVVVGVMALALGAAPWLLSRDVEAADEKPRAAPAAKGDAGPRYDPENTTAISRAMETIVQGNQRYVDKDYQGALEAYKRAIGLSPRNALAHYLAGETQLALKNPQEAELAFKEADASADDRNPALRARILFSIADLKERDRKVEDARAAWKTYTDYAARYADAGVPFLKSGEDRIRVIDELTKLDKAYEIVRQRIIAEKDSGADAGPAPKK